MTHDDDEAAQVALTPQVAEDKRDKSESEDEDHHEDGEGKTRDQLLGLTVFSPVLNRRELDAAASPQPTGARDPARAKALLETSDDTVLAEPTSEAVEKDDDNSDEPHSAAPEEGSPEFEQHVLEDEVAQVAPTSEVAEDKDDDNSYMADESDEDSDYQDNHGDKPAKTKFLSNGLTFDKITKHTKSIVDKKEEASIKALQDWTPSEGLKHLVIRMSKNLPKLHCFLDAYDIVKTMATELKFDVATFISIRAWDVNLDVLDKEGLPRVFYRRFEACMQVVVKRGDAVHHSLFGQWKNSIKKLSNEIDAVPYTHLTLPTIYTVMTSVVSVSIDIIRDVYNTLRCSMSLTL